MLELKLKNEALDMLIKLIKHYEGLHDGDLREIGLQPKMCPAGYWTEGYGIVVTDNKGKMIRGKENKALAYKFSKIKTEEQAINALIPALAARENFILKLNLELNDYQLAALISFVYNIGSGNFLKSSVLKEIRGKRDKTKIDKYIRAFNKAGGKVLPGLVKRRTAESYLFIINKLKLF